MYLVDVYKKKLLDINLKNFLVFFFFLSKFNSWSISSPNSFIPQIIQNLKFSSKNFTTASLLILRGYFFKNYVFLK